MSSFLRGRSIRAGVAQCMYVLEMDLLELAVNNVTVKGRHALGEATGRFYLGWMCVHNIIYDRRQPPYVESTSDLKYT